MTFDPYQLIKYHLYLLQLENYQLGRFWKLLLNKGWFPKKQPQRKSLVWTKKAIVLFALVEVLILGLALLLYYYKVSYLPFAYAWQKFAGFLVTVYIFDFFTPIFLSLAVVILSPLDFALKQVVVLKARAKIKKLPNLKIIGIAGSYGKTTMKDVLASVLASHFKVAKTPESVNTPVGIAEWALNRMNESAQILIIEMGEHYKGDVKELCRLVPPDISVITGINQAHLERMGTMDTVISTIFEAVSYSKPKAEIFLNADDSLVMKHYKKFVWPDHKVQEYKVESAKYKVFNSHKLGWEAEFEDLGKVDINLLGEYALGDVDAAIKIARGLAMGAEDINKGIANIKPVEHRLQPVKGAGDVLIIDDAYNGNPDGVGEAIKVLGRFPNKRKIYITPGLVEMGKDSADVHRAIGKELAAVADVVILIKNSVTPFIEQGLLEIREKRQVNVIWFDTAQEAHSSLGKILRPGDVVVFQNDWGDNYL